MESANGHESKKARRTIGTHSGTFHCDEALACFMLKQLPEYKNASILRSRDDSELRSTCDIIVDVGGEFDLEKKWFDHHQKTFTETLSSLKPEMGNEFNKIRLSSAGLIYTFYGERLIQSILKEHGNIELSEANLKLVFKQVYRNFISEIDAIDNGVPMVENAEPLYSISTNLSARVGKLNPSWEQGSVPKETIDKLFETAMETTGKEFVENVLFMGLSWIKAREIVREAIANAKEVYPSGEILMLERFCPWKSHLADLEKELNIEGVPKLVLFSENPNSWRVQGVPVAVDSFLGRKFLPAEWRGLRDEELSSAADIPDLVFVHHSGFIGGAKTKEAALKMAIKAVEWSS